MRIMSEKRFESELAKAKEEIYQRETMDRRYMEMMQQIDTLRHAVEELRFKVEDRPKMERRAYEAD